MILAAQRIHSVNSILALGHALDYTPGHLTPTSFQAMGVTSSLRAADGNMEADPNHPLYGRTVCFTGSMFQ